MAPFITAGAGFLLAVLWFDLMFDVQARRRREHSELSSEVLASIAAYYARVTTGARPMNRLIALVMLATSGAIVAQIARGERPLWAAWVSLVLTAGAVVLAATHTVPSAVRLGARREPPHEESRLARSILRDHVVCFVAVGAVLVIQLGW